MLLTISTTHAPATELGYLLHKNPERVQQIELAFGHAHIFYPEASEDRCTVALIVDIDPVALVRSRGPSGDRGHLAQYVNDRPYVASSFLSVALANAFGTALAGRSKERPELAATPIPLSARIVSVACRGGEALLRQLFEPLGYDVAVHWHERADDPLAPGHRRYASLALTGTCRLTDLLSHLYVLLPVMDDDKHYWVGDSEVEKLLRHGEGWLVTHPARDLITRRYLKHQGSLVRDAVSRLCESEEASDDGTAEPPDDAGAGARPHRTNLHEQRLSTVLEVLRASGATSVLDLGCGEGRLLRLLLGERQFTRIVGMDVSYRSLEQAAERLKLDRLADTQRSRISVLHGSLVYTDQRLAGFDAAAVVEVIEHLDPPRLRAFERALFEHARPATVVLTTPNEEYNVRWPSLAAGAMRHADHRFEWTRAEFQTWATTVAQRCHYEVRFDDVGPADPEVGAPSQLAVFARRPTHGD